MYRREGVQVNRVRVREVANPKTTSQATQRNFLSPVSKFYAPLAACLEKSYEGLNKSKSYTAFLKKNIDLARQNGWYLPKGTPFFPLPYQISRGTLPPVNAEIFRTDGDDFFRVVGSGTESMTDTATVAQISALFVAMGHRYGDQVTLVAVQFNGTVGYDSAEYYPVYERFYLAEDDNRALNDVLKNFYLEQVRQGAIWFGCNLTGENVAAAVIVSRYENGQWRRSTERLSVDQTIMDLVTSGDYAALSIATYQQNSTTHLSDVYLNGQNMVLATTSQDGTLIEIIGIRETTFVDDDTEVPVLVAFDKGGKNYFIKNDLTGATENGKVLATKDSYVTNNPGTLDSKNTVQFSAADSRLAQWLRVKGVAASVFQ